MLMKHTHTSDEKIKWWGYGEWVEEPDEATFEHKGIDCRVVRIACVEPYSKEFHVFGGHFCGYIKVPYDHFYYGKSCSDIDLECHGGLTYSEIDDQNHDYLLKKGHWIGFDCAHSFDIIPSTEYLRKTIPSLIEIEKKFQRWKETIPDHSLFWDKSYKNIEFCIEECKSMTDQLVNTVKHEN